jgi:multiple sugar transport system permease protein
MSQSKRERNTVAFVALLVGSALMIFPFVWMVLSAFKTQADVYKYPPQWMPSSFKSDNFQAVFRNIPFLRFYLNSIVTSFAQTALVMLIAIAGAYAFVKLDFPGRRKFCTFMQSSMFVPEVVSMIPLFLVVSAAGLVDTYPGIVLPQLHCAFTTLLLMSFFETIPNDLIDAAKIDGYGYYRILARIVVPNAKTAISAGSLFVFLGAWRSYLWPLIVTNSTKLRTLPIGLKYLVAEKTAEYQVMMAASLMAIVPVLLVYVLAERQFVQSITLTGLKA